MIDLGGISLYMPLNLTRTDQMGSNYEWLISI